MDKCSCISWLKNSANCQKCLFFPLFLHLQHLRGSTDGLSPFFFVCAFIANVLYGLSVFLYSVHISFLLASLPWLIGRFVQYFFFHSGLSIGVLFLDMIVMLQFIVYKIKKSKQKKDQGVEVELKEDDFIYYKSNEHSSQDNL